MSKVVPDAWEDAWSTTADTNPNTSSEANAELKKISGKVTKAQRRAQQAEFNKQIWDQAEAPQETNFFLESRNVMPLRSEYKPPPILLSRKGPVVVSRKPPTDGVTSLTLKAESSEDEDDAAAKPLTLAERQAQATKDREEKQRRYEERRQELFGNVESGRPKSSSGKSSPGDLTPPNSRSATPSRARGRVGRRGGSSMIPPQLAPQRDLYEPAYSLRPDSAFVQRRENGTPRPASNDIQPIRAPKGPDGSGRGGFGFASRGGLSLSADRGAEQPLETT